MKGTAATAAPPAARRTVEPRPHARPLVVRIEHADEDDPDVVERVVQALADVLSGRVG